MEALTLFVFRERATTPCHLVNKLEESGKWEKELSPDSPSQLIPTRVNNILDSKTSEYLKRRMLSSASCDDVSNLECCCLSNV